MSNEFETWASRLRLPFLGPKGRAVVGGIARVFDLTTEYAQRAVLEHFPSFASREANLLTASERGIIVRHDITNEALVPHLLNHVAFRRLSGTAAGILWALDIIGFSDAILVQANGRGFRFADPLDAVPTSAVSREVPGRTDVVMHVYTLGRHPFFPEYPTGRNGWWLYGPTFDYEFVSRFSIILDERPPTWTAINATPTTTTSPSINELRLLVKAVDSMAPAKATFKSLVVRASGPTPDGPVVQSRLWGWPLHQWGDGIKWGGVASTKWNPSDFR